MDDVGQTLLGVSNDDGIRRVVSQQNASQSATERLCVSFFRDTVMRYVPTVRQLVATRNKSKNAISFLLIS